MEQIASTYIPLASAIVSVVFAVLVLKRYSERGGQHNLFWGIGMIFYAIGGFTEAYYGAFGFQIIVYKLWYLCGAILVAAWLGQGTVFLLWKNKSWDKVSASIFIGVVIFIATIVSGLMTLTTNQVQNVLDNEIEKLPVIIGVLFFGISIVIGFWLVYKFIFTIFENRSWANFSLYTLIIASVISTILIIFATVTPEALDGFELTARGVLPKYMRNQTPFYNIYGTLFLVGGAIYSAWIFYKKRIFLHRVIGNILIAIGALAPAIGGTLNRAGAVPYALYIGELIGAILLFAGFLRATTPMGEDTVELAESAEIGRAHV